jgi:hypothetical protein
LNVQEALYNPRSNTPEFDSTNASNRQSQASFGGYNADDDSQPMLKVHSENDANEPFIEYNRRERMKDFAKDLRKERKKFRCCPTRPLYRIICAVVTLLILAGLAVVGYFYFPR